MRFSEAISGGIALSALLWTIPAVAQQSSDDRAEDGLALDEIIVTADRLDSFGADLVQVGTFRGSRLIDVPLTVNVVPRKVLDAQAAEGIYGALRNTAGSAARN